MTMSRITRDAVLGLASDVELEPSRLPKINALPAMVRASDYLQSNIAARPLPDKLLDRLADLYWTERESELAI